jgi:hypothetical protein
MVREKITVSTRTLQWKCVESRTDSKRLYYGRFILSPLMKGQAYMFYEMISGFICYALHRVRVCLLSFLHFSAMRFASLYRRERPLS